MMSPNLPGVLQGKGQETSIPMERALNQIKDLLEEHAVDHGDDDRVQASIDDVDMMLRHIVR